MIGKKQDGLYEFIATKESAFWTLKYDDNLEVPEGEIKNVTIPATKCEL